MAFIHGDGAAVLKGIKVKVYFGNFTLKIHSNTPGSWSVAAKIENLSNFDEKHPFWDNYNESD